MKRGFTAWTQLDWCIARRLAVLFFVLYMALTRGHFQSTDEVVVYQTAQSMWERGEMAVATRDSGQPGREGRSYSRYGIAQSALSVPLYGLGRGVESLCETMDLGRWKAAFEQLPRRRGAVAWSGEVSIFFVMLLPCAFGALTCAATWLLARRLGSSRNAALAVVALVGLASHAATFAGQYFQHAGETCFLLWAVLLLVHDAGTPSWKARAWAGAAAGMLLLTRIHGVIALPWLCLYVASHELTAWPVDSASLRRAIRRCVPFVAPILVALAVALGVNWMRFGELTLTGNAGATQGQPASLLTGLWGLLFSPGASVVLYSPPLLLLLGAYPWFARIFRREAALIGAIAVTYLVVHASYARWHGQCCIGPRYLAATVPLLLATVPPWLGRPGRLRWIAAAALGVVGFVFVMLQFLVSWWQVISLDNLDVFRRGDAILFVPESSQLLAHARALASPDARVDFWLKDVALAAGGAQALLVAGLLALALSLSAKRVVDAVRRPDDWDEGEARRHRRRRLTWVLAASFLALLAVGRVVQGSVESSSATRAAFMSREAQDAAMALGWKALSQQQDPATAVTHFQRVLAANPGHYGASFQMGRALDMLGRRDDAVPHFEMALEIAIANRDSANQAWLLERLVTPEAMVVDDAMRLGVAALHERSHPNAAAAIFEEVLRRYPRHYGATFQLAVALDRANRPAEAIQHWVAVLGMAAEAKDEPTFVRARERLGTAR